jgi:hypothetical protein
MISGRVRNLAILAAVSCGSAVWAQAVISAKSGVINYTEGEVLAGDVAVEPKNGKFPEWKKGQELRTTEGRAEVLLTPGVFVRIAENSKLNLIENRLSDTRVQLIEGSILVECAELLEDNSVTFSYGEFNIAIRKAGLYRIEADPSSVKVYEGELQIAGAGQVMTLRKGKQTQLAGVLNALKFDVKTTDSFYRWAARRAEPLSLASFSAAKSIYSSGGGLSYSGWMFNPYYGLYTFIPYRGFYNSPFGFRFYSPVVVNNVYNNYVNAYTNSGGYNVGGNNGSNSWNRDSFFDSSRGYAVSTRGNVGSYSSPSAGSVGGGAISAPSAPAPAAGRGDMGGGGSARGDSGGGARGK